MERYKRLHSALGKPDHQDFPPDSFFESQKKKTDEDLITLWQEDGWASYANGLFWTVNPQDFTNIIKDWKISKPNSIVFSRNAFGDLFLLRKGEIYRLTVQDNYLGNIGPGVYNFLNFTLKEPSLKESFLQKRLFSKVYKLLGKLEADECYGLFPALPLGGDEEDPKAYRRVKLREYLVSLAQMHE